MTTTHVQQPLVLQPSRGGEMLRRLIVRSGPLLRGLAGRRFLTIWAVIRYRGRRSGKEYALPIAIAATPDGFVIPMPFGGAQWVLNVLAAGECQIRWNGRDWSTTKPEVIDAAEGAKFFGLIPRLALSVLPIHRFLRLRRL
jgi:hypothetical protein